MGYIYKNETGRPVNIGGFQFAAGFELASGIIIKGFKEAVTRGDLSLREEWQSAQGKSEPKGRPAQAPADSIPARLAAAPEERGKGETDAAREEKRLAKEARKAEKARIAAEAAAPTEREAQGAENM